MDEFFTGDIWGISNNKFKSESAKNACIAYITSKDLVLSKGDTLICDASEYSIKFGNTSANTLAYYLDKKVKIYSNQNLHSKFLFNDKLLMLGSANLSSNSANHLIESAILTSSPDLISQAKAFYYDLLLDKSTHKINSTILKKLLSIKVIKRPRKPSSKSTTREKIFGAKKWFVPVSPLSEKIYKTIKKNVEEVSETLAKTNRLDVDDIAFVRWRNNTIFTRDAKAGDEIILKWSNKNKTRTTVYPPATILKKEAKNGFTHFYYDATKEDQGKMPWTRFKALTKRILGKPIPGNFHAIKKEDLHKIRIFMKT